MGMRSLLSELGRLSVLAAEAAGVEEMDPTRIGDYRITELHGVVYIMHDGGNIVGRCIPDDMAPLVRARISQLRAHLRIMEGPMGAVLRPIVPPRVVVAAAGIAHCGRPVILAVYQYSSWALIYWELHRFATAGQASVASLWVGRAGGVQVGDGYSWITPWGLVATKWPSKRAIVEAVVREHPKAPPGLVYYWLDGGWGDNVTQPGEELDLVALSLL